MGSGKNLNAFLSTQRARNATIVTYGSGDSRYRRNGHGETYGFAQALATAAGGWVGIMLGFNRNSSQVPHDGFFRAGPRSSGNLQTGFALARPTGTAGIESPDFVTLDAVTLGGALAENTASGDTITLAGEYTGWPTSNLYVRVGTEIVYATTRSGASLSLGTSTTVATQGTALTGTGTGTFTVAAAPGDWPTAGEVRVASEFMRVSRSGTTITVTERGLHGTTAVAHAVSEVVGWANLYRAQLNTKQQAWSSGAVSMLAGRIGLSWLSPHHAYLHASTVASEGTAFAGAGTGTGTFTIQATDAEGWPTASHQIRVGNEYMTATRSGATLTVTARGQWSSSAVDHVVGENVSLVSWDGFSRVHLHAKSPTGYQGAVRHVVFMENPTAGVVRTGAQFQDLIQHWNVALGGMASGEDAVTAPTITLATGAIVNPTWTDAIGTLGCSSLIAPATTASNRSVSGVAADAGAQLPIVGPALLTWQFIGAAFHRGGLVHMAGPSQGGTSLFEFARGLTKTTDYQKSLVKLFQCAQKLGDANMGGANASAFVFHIAFGSNDLSYSDLAWATPSKAWTAKFTPSFSGAFADNAATLTLSSTAGLPTAGHGVNTRTGERVSWTGISGGDLTGCKRGQFGTVAAGVNNGDAFWIGFQARDDRGIPSTVVYVDAILRGLWSVADISATNLNYPVAAAGDKAMLAAGLGAPNAARDFLTIWSRPTAVWDSGTSGLGDGAAIDSYAKREGRLAEIAAVFNQYVLPDHPGIDFADLGPSTMTSTEIASAHADVNAATTLSGAIATTGNVTASLASAIVPATEPNGFLIIGPEVVAFTNVSGTSITVTSRGVAGSVAQTHSIGAGVIYPDVIHPSGSGFVEAYARWFDRAVIGSGASGGLGNQIGMATIKGGRI